MTRTITAALASSARGEDDILRRDFLKTATATAVLTATLPVQARETPAMSNAILPTSMASNIFYSVHAPASRPFFFTGRQP
jgi:hypothetical protein